LHSFYLKCVVQLSPLAVYMWGAHRIKLHSLRTCNSAGGPGSPTANANRFVMATRLPRTLKRLDDIVRSLAETRSLKDVKAIRDKAEAARHFAQSAALGLKIQNRAAELKLRAERRAGELLSELAPHGGNRRPSSHEENLKLSDLGIDHNQSARWRREATVSDAVFERYLAAANELGKEITAQGLLRLERLSRNDRSNVSPSEFIKRAENRATTPRNRATPDTVAEQVRELFDEIKNHRSLLEKLLQPLCSGQTSLASPEKRLVLRLLREVEDVVMALESLWDSKGAKVS
jgi:hypothetical protein